MQALEGVQARLASPRSRLKTRLAAEQAARDALASAGSERWLAFEITDTEQESFRQEKRGRPGEQTRYRKTTKTIFTLTFAVNDEQVAYDAATDGQFPLVTNDHDLTDPELLAAYRYQPNLEKRHHQLKTVLSAAPCRAEVPITDRGTRLLRVHRAALPMPDRTRATRSDDTPRCH